MPEIAEVARAVHHLRHHLSNRTVSSVNALDDAKLLLTAKTGLTGPTFAAALKGKKVLDARQQGKYFWLVMDSPPHPLLHFGMTGWIKFKGDGGQGEYRRMKEKKERQKAARDEAKKEEAEVEGDGSEEEEEWPPRFWKFVLQTTDGVEAAFVDSRRFGAIRLLDAPADELRNTSPLKENGPDPVVDKGIVTQEWLSEKLQKKRVPVKALLLDQAVLSGIGNWVADEILFQARIHPEQYCNTLDEAQTKQLHDKLISICTTACDLLADSSRFPESWLMRHRWDKGKQGGSRLANGEKIVHVTVGGRTSAVVPSVQKKTGPVAGDVSEEEEEVEEKSNVKAEEPKSSKRRKEASQETTAPKVRSQITKRTAAAKDTKPSKSNSKDTSKGTKRKSEVMNEAQEAPAKKNKTDNTKNSKAPGQDNNRRKSARLRGS
ncbi:MAG: hypothetical protein M1828_002743 [Chrysothrix sp. TS-e1954]|nr:MAG: hypothetical protein M1828_002743 [Chrysothrix sp. TS-e1954]